MPEGVEMFNQRLLLLKNALCATKKTSTFLFY